MKDLVKTLEGLPWIVRVLLTVLWGLYSNLLRLFRSLAANNVIGIVLAVVLILCGGFFILWIIDVIMVLLGKKIWWID
ncbi:MAG: hypothetical protein IJX78_02850 [Bacilli bacterium]|nr:hypothetical protein [Bacilli bacterium]